MDELISKSTRPAKQPGSEIKAKPKPVPLNAVRGFMPKQVDETVVDETVSESVKAVSVDTTKSIAELTGIRIDEQKFTKGKKKGEINTEETLNTILTELTENTKDATGVKESI